MLQARPNCTKIQFPGAAVTFGRLKREDTRRPRPVHASPCASFLRTAASKVFPNAFVSELWLLGRVYCAHRRVTLHIASLVKTESGRTRGLLPMLGDYTKLHKAPILCKPRNPRPRACREKQLLARSRPALGFGGGSGLRSFVADLVRFIFLPDYTPGTFDKLDRW